MEVGNKLMNTEEVINLDQRKIKPAKGLVFTEPQY